MAVDFRTDSGRLSVYTTIGGTGILIREFDIDHYFKVINDYIVGINMIDDKIIYKANDIDNITLDGAETDVAVLAELLNTTLVTLNNSSTVTVDVGTLATAAKQDLLLTELQLKADLTETQPVSLASVPLPVGASVASKQDEEILIMRSLLDRNNGTFDAFYRQRFSLPEQVFDSKQIGNKQSLVWDDQLVSGSGGASTYNANQASTTLSVGNLTAGKRVRQTFQHFNYQPLKSQLWVQTGILGTAKTGITVEAGSFNGSNGMFFRVNSSGLSVNLTTSTSGAPVNTSIAQADWNIDKLDGTGASGISLDLSKTLIWGADYEWLGVGTIRFFFFIGGRPYYCHEINNSNINTLVYMSTPNLPLRYSIENDGTGAAADMTTICSAVVSEGGRQVKGRPFGVTRGATVLTTGNNTNIYPLIGIRLNANNIGSLIKIVDFSINCSSTAIFEYIFLLNPTVTGTAPTWTDLTNSSIDTWVTSTNATTLTGGTILMSKITSQGNGDSGGANEVFSNDFSLGSNIAGTADILYLAVRRLTGTTETFYASLNLNDQQ